MWWWSVGGGTGGALAHDLVRRGLPVTLLEPGELTSGTTGRHHGLLHSGARYAVNDPESAVECIAENRILRRIAPGSFEENGGLFVALTDEDMDYLPRFLTGCAACDIPTRELTMDEALAWSQASTRRSKRPSGSRTPPWTPCGCRCASSPARAGRGRAAALHRGHRPTGDRPADQRSRDPRPGGGADGQVAADLVVNATGPWCERLAAMAGAAVPVQPSPGCCWPCRAGCASWSSTASTGPATATSWCPAGPVDRPGRAPGPSRTPTTWRCPTSMSRPCTGRGPS